MTWLMARGIVRSGFSASPAVMPMSSMPPNENITTAVASSSPQTPCGRKPSFDQRLLKFSGNGWPLEKSSPRPSRIMLTIAAILMSAIQNSASPYAFTFTRLSAVIETRQTSAESHCGRSGNQKFI